MSLPLRNGKLTRRSRVLLLALAATLVLTGGCNRRSTGPRTDLNHAGETELNALPGFNSERSLHVIQLRPWDSTHQLVEKGILSQLEYERIAGRITAR